MAQARIAASQPAQRGAGLQISSEDGISANVEIACSGEIRVDNFHRKSHFQQMLKIPDSLNELEHRAAAALRALLDQVPAISSTDVELEVQGMDWRADILARVNTGDRRHVLVCEIKASGQPRHVRMAVLQLRNYAAHYGTDAIPIFIAPYLSREAQALCREQGVGFLDLEGNARLVFDGVFIERLVPGKPAADRRELRSIFKPKSAQVLRVMLRDPRRSWRVADLAAAADVSLGHISNVRLALLDREWAGIRPDGMFLTEPDQLLDAWRDAYEPPAGKRLGFYTTLHGGAFVEAARAALSAANKSGAAMFASFSAAHWLAPYARTGSQYFYADETGVDALREVLRLSSAAKGENGVVTRLEDRGLFHDAIEPAPGIVCTSQVQTYLDLAAAGERGREAADHLRRERLIWPG